MQHDQHFLAVVQAILRSIGGIVLLLSIGGGFLLIPSPSVKQERSGPSEPTDLAQETISWKAPDSVSMANEPDRELLQYGRELVAHTSVYLGPNGKVARMSNGMNCQNCHLQAGTKPYGNNYAAVASTYPKFRARSGTIESVEKRVNDCIERSLNGQALDSSSREMRAFVAYIRWVGKEVPKGEVPKGTGLKELPLLERPADPVKGKEVYNLYCKRCHGIHAKGVRTENGREWKYPPLWGDSSYNVGAGLYRLSRFAAYVKYNMPDGISYENPALTDEEAWDVAAYINSLPRPTKDLSRDWPDITLKPFDHPFGPFADTFPEHAHKYGPFAAIRAAKKK